MQGRWAEMPQVFQYDIYEESALRIVKHILSLFGNLVLGIQHETVVGERSPNKTRAGEAPQNLSVEREEHEKNAAELKRGQEEASRVIGCRGEDDSLPRQEGSTTQEEA